MGINFEFLGLNSFDYLLHILLFSATLFPMMLPIQIKRLYDTVPVPEYKTSGAVAFDIAVHEEVVINPGETKILSTGLIMKVPEGHVLIIANRSSNIKKRLMLANNIGIIDQDYCGPKDQIYLGLYNFGSDPYTTQIGERLAQGLLIPIERATFKDVSEIEQQNRGGFGSTG